MERAAKNILHAETAEVLVASPDRPGRGAGLAVRGNAFAHIAYDRQCRLKAEIIGDALGRIGRLSSPPQPEVLGSPERGYRMRARLREGRPARFFEESSHQLCDAAVTGQLLTETTEWIAAAERLITREQLAGLSGIELSENIRGDERACHLDLDAGVDASRFAALAESLTGLSAARSDRPGVELLAGIPTVSDVLHVDPDDPRSALRLRRDVGNILSGKPILAGAAASSCGGAGRARARHRLMRGRGPVRALAGRGGCRGRHARRGDR